MFGADPHKHTLTASVVDVREPRRYRFNRGGNRRVNAVLHLMAITQLRCEPRAREIYDKFRARGHTKKEAMRVLKRHLSNIVYKTMIRDAERHATEAPNVNELAA